MPAGPLFLSWLKSFFDCTSSEKALVDSLSSYARLFSPIGKCLCAPGVCDIAVAPRVAGLLLPGTPLAVFWRIVAVVVDAVNTVAYWRIAHVLVERLKGVAPPFADSYPASPVVLVAAAVWVMTSLFHTAPDIVYVAVGSAVCGQLLFSYAPTASGFAAASKVPRYHFLDRPAVTYDSPERTHVLASVGTRDKQSSESLAGEVDEVMSASYASTALGLPRSKGVSHHFFDGAAVTLHPPVGSTEFPVPTSKADDYQLIKPKASQVFHLGGKFHASHAVGTPVGWLTYHVDYNQPMLRLQTLEVS